MDAEVEEDGTVLVSGRLLADICRALPNRPVEISTDGVRATVVCGSSRFTLHTLPVEEYPALPQMPTATGTVPGEVFASAAAQVAIAAGRDDTLPVLTGVRIEIEGDTVTLASTDRYRFAVREFLWKPENPDASAVALVPAKTLLDTAKALTSGDTVTLALSGSGAGRGPDRLRGRRPPYDHPAARRRPAEVPHAVPDRVQLGRRDRDRARSSRPSSVWPWSPSATPRSGSASSRAC